LPLCIRRSPFFTEEFETMVLKIENMRAAVQRYRDKTVHHETSLYSPPGVKLNPVDLDGWRELGLEGCGGVTDDELVEDFKEVKDGGYDRRISGGCESTFHAQPALAGEKRAPSVFRNCRQKTHEPVRKLRRLFILQDQFV
jgi:hypothetical protein